MKTDTTTTPETISLPALAVACGVTPDRLRVLVRRSAALAALFESVSGLRFIRAADLPRARELIAVLNTPTRIAASAG
jgi:hypothetical protein